jgi:hypothetical protein
MASGARSLLPRVIEPNFKGAPRTAMLPRGSEMCDPANHALALGQSGSL